jgi:hypothetical protein
MVTPAKKCEPEKLAHVQLCPIISKGKGSPSASLPEIDKSLAVQEQQTSVKAEKGNIKQ